MRVLVIQKAEKEKLNNFIHLLAPFVSEKKKNIVQSVSVIPTKK